MKFSLYYFHVIVSRTTTLKSFSKVRCWQVLQYGQVLTLQWQPGGVFSYRSHTWIPFLQLTIYIRKRVWRLSSVGHEMPPAGDPWLLRQLVCNHGPFCPCHGVSRLMGISWVCWPCSLVQWLCSRRAAWQVWRQVWGTWDGGGQEHVCEVSSQVLLRAWCPQDSKPCCAIWGTAMLHSVLKELHNICGWGMWP